MKSLSLLLLLGAAQMLFGQNTPPQIEMINTTIDEVAQQVTLSYSLEDADNDFCEVWLKYSTDGGVYFQNVEASSVSGAIGNDIEPTADALLTWDYSGLTIAIADVHLRLYASDHAVVDIAEMVSQVDENQLLDYLQQIEGERHFSSAPEHLESVRQLIRDAFITFGLDTEDHEFVHNQTEMRNVIGRQAGMRDEAITIIVDGHFDGVPGSPGADDNGSAVAGVLEALRILSQYTFEHSIRFIGFDAEELGLIGSLRYVQNGIKPFESIQGVLNFEMIGYYDDAPNTQDLPAGFELLFPDAAQAVAEDENRGNFITVVGNVNANPLIGAFESAAATYVPDLRVISVAVPGNGSLAPDLRRSDHASFWDGGYQALMLTDGADFRNFNYHTPNDVISTLNFEFMANVVKATLATAAQQAVPISADFAEVELSNHVGVDTHQHRFEAKVRLYPNPTDGLLSVLVTDNDHGFKSRMEVYNMNGQLVHRELRFFTPGTSGARLDLQHLADGSYILVMHAGNAAQSLGFILRR